MPTEIEKLQADFKKLEDELKRFKELENRPIEESKARSFITTEVNRLLLRYVLGCLAAFGITSAAIAWQTIGKIKDGLKTADGKVSALTKQSDDITKQCNEIAQRIAPLDKNSVELQSKYDELTKTYTHIKGLNITQQDEIIQAIEHADTKDVLGAIKNFNTENRKAVDTLSKELDNKVSFDSKIRLEDAKYNLKLTIDSVDTSPYGVFGHTSHGIALFVGDVPAKYKDLQFVRIKREQ